MVNSLITVRPLAAARPCGSIICRKAPSIRANPGKLRVLATFAAEVFTASPEEFVAIQSRDRERYGVFIRDANIHAD